MRRIQLTLLFVFLLLSLSNLTVIAQVGGQGSTPAPLAKGRPIGSYQISEVENINYFSGHLSINIPVSSGEGRGTGSYPVTVSLNSPSWSAHMEYIPDNSGNGTTVPAAFANYEYPGRISAVPGGNYQGIEATKRMQYIYSDPYHCLGAPFYQGALTKIYVTMPDGTEYEFRDTQTEGQQMNQQYCGYYRNRGRTFVTRDGTNLKFVADDDVLDDWYSGQIIGYLYTPDGTVYRYNGMLEWIRDRNGNLTTVENAVENGVGVRRVVDSIGRRTSIQGFYHDGTSPTTSLIKYKGYGGADRQVSVVGGTLGNNLATGESILSLSQLFPAFDYIWNYWSGSFVISEVVLPNGQSYKFKYNSYGEVARMETPTGAVVEYMWASGIDGGHASGQVNVGSVADTFIYRRVIERRLYANGTNLTSTTTISRPEYVNPYYQNYGYLDIKTYTPDTSNSSNLASFERHYYHGKASSTFTTANNNPNYQPWTNGKEYKTEIFNPADSSLLRRTTYSFDQTAPSWWNYACGPLCSYGNPDHAPPNNPVLTETTITLETNQIAKQTFAYDGNLNRTDVYDYDYGSGAAGSFLRRTHTDYLTTNPANNNINYTTGNNYLLNLPSQTWVSSDSAGNNKGSLIKYEYDNYATDTYHAGLTSRNSVVGFDSANFGTGNSVRGNVTAVTSYANASGTPSGEISVYSQYDVLGNAVKTIDGKGNATTIGYNDNFGSPDNNSTTNSAPGQLNGMNTFAFPTSTSNPLTWTAYMQFDYFMGSQVNTQDVNGLISKTIYNDLLDRPTQTVAAIGTAHEMQTTIIYDDTNRKVMSTSDLNALNDNLLKKESLFDKLGRITENRIYEADGDYVAIVTKYDALGRTYKRSNPYRPSETPENDILWTTTSFDALSRVTEIETPDCAVITNCHKAKTAFDGNRILVTDQADKQRISKTNAIGHLTDIWEITVSDAATVSVSFPNQSLSAGYLTGYEYDVNGNLTTVTQAIPNTQITQTRNFTYDSFSRLKEATNLESGTTKYTYDANGNVQTKWNARNIKTIYEYDVLNRITKRCYKVVTGSLGATNCTSASGETDEPHTYDPAYTYENSSITNLKGVLTKVDNGFSKTENTQFDAIGRITRRKQTTDGTAYNEMEYVYNLSGDLIEETYPSGRRVKNTIDNAGQFLQVQSKKNAASGYWTYADSFTFTAAGAVSSMQLGNGHWESTSFNERLQPIQIALGSTPAATNLLRLNYSYGQWESGTLNAAKNNGNIAQHVTRIPTTTSYIDFTQKYEYDALNRITNAVETESVGSTQTWRQSFTYDRYGNRNFDEANTTTLTKSCGTSPNFTVCTADRKVENPSISTSNNRIVQDQDGDTVNDYTFDTGGNTTKDATGQQYVYDGENKIVQATLGSNTLGMYYYDGDGRRVKKVTYENGQPAEATIFLYNASGMLVSEYSTALSSVPEVGYLTSDMLGSPRINTNPSGGVISRHDYQPFGEEISTPQRTANGYGSDEVRKKFTGYERDDETGLDFAQARYFSSGFGRFSSPDDFLNDTHVSDPQSWNLYVYVRNNPLRYIDPTGKDIETNPDGTVKFVPDKIDKKTGQGKAENYILEKKDLGGGKFQITQWSAVKGTVYFKNGDKTTAVTAFQKASPVSVTVQTEFQTSGGTVTVVDQKESQRLTGLAAKWDNTSDCHGLTFGKGQVWIENDQVKKIIENDGYRELAPGEKPQKDDVGIYAEGKNFKLGNTQHSVSVNTVSKEGDVTDVRSKGGVGPIVNVSPRSAWDSRDNQNFKDNTQLKYFTKRVQQ